MRKGSEESDENAYRQLLRNSVIFANANDPKDSQELFCTAGANPGYSFGGAQKMFVQAT